MNCLKIIHFNISRTEETYISRIISKIKILDQLKQFVASNPIIFLILFEIETVSVLFRSVFTELIESQRRVIRPFATVYGSPSNRLCHAESIGFY